LHALADGNAFAYARVLNDVIHRISVIMTMIIIIDETSADDLSADPVVLLSVRLLGNQPSCLETTDVYLHSRCFRDSTTITKEPGMKTRGMKMPGEEKRMIIKDFFSGGGEEVMAVT